MSLKLKFNIALILSGLIGLAGTAWIANDLFRRHAQEEVLQNAELMLQSALAIRHYTVSEIRPLLQKQESETFIPQTVPAYAASRFVQILQKSFPDYSYKEAAINPTNPANRATDWEADIIDYFASHPDSPQLISERETVTGPVLYLSKPIRIGNPGCLACHSTPDKAPESVLARYGRTNGFGWKLNETIGAQIVAVPKSLPLQRARSELFTFVGALLGVFALIGIILNLLLHFFVTRPITRMATHAEEVSLGTLDLPELPDSGRDEVSMLARAFNRMQRSLNNAMKMMSQ